MMFFIFGFMMRTQASTIFPTSFAIPPVVLAVDDSTDTLNILCKEISAAGYVVISASSADEAIKCLEFAVPDIILLDAISPEIRGFELGRRIKSMPIWSKIPILFMIDRENAKQIINSYENGGIDYISKPLHVPEIIARLFTCVVTRANAK